MRERHTSPRRKAVAGIVATILFFTLLFTVGTGFFLFINGTNLSYSKALVAKANVIQNLLSENLLVNTLLVNNHIGVSIKNTGGSAANVTSIFVFDQSGNVLSCLGTAGICAGSGGGLPLVVTPTKSSGVIDTTYTPGSGTFGVKVLTQLGRVYSASYPPVESDESDSSPLTQLFASGGFGSLFLTFDSYTYFGVTTGGACPPAGGSNSGYCLNNLGKAFQISASFVSSNNVAFAVTFTNVDPKQANITLDKYTSIFDYWPVGSSFRTARAYIISNETNTIQSKYTPIVLYYDKPVTIVFGSLNPGAFSPISFSGSNAPSAGTIAAVNIVSHGWKAVSYSKLKGESPPAANYGQNSPFVTTSYV